MTQHTRIAVSEERSLLERAAPRFGFAAPPVPKLPEAAPGVQLRPAVVAPFAPTPLVAAKLPFSGERHPIDREHLRTAGLDRKSTRLNSSHG